MSHSSLDCPEFLLRNCPECKIWRLEFFNFLGEDPQTPPPQKKIFIFPACRRGHHADRVCHLSLDFISQSCIGFCTLVSGTNDCSTHLSATWTSLVASDTPRPPAPFLSALCVMVMTHKKSYALFRLFSKSPFWSLVWLSPFSWLSSILLRLVFRMQLNQHYKVVASEVTFQTSPYLLNLDHK